MDESRDYHTKSERQIPYDITYTQNLKYDTNEHIYETDSKQTCGCQAIQTGNGLGVWVPRCRLLYIEWIKNQILPYTTGNYIQYPMIDHNEKYEKEYILKLNHFAAQQKLT